MGGGQPYIYAAPKRYSTQDPWDGFDPKAVTRASWQPPPPPKPKTKGPLLDINRHPDSYTSPPYGKTNVKPMNPKIKGQVKWVRWIQLGFRWLQMIGAIGLLICVIFIRGTQNTEGWILRLPPGVDILSNCYAIYHLFRPAKARTPASSASYHFFSFFMDVGLIPFYVFAAIMARNNYEKKPGEEGRWRTFFNDDAPTEKILLSTWLTAVATGGLHLVSLGLDIWLIIVFRKISNLPPDMNPLEDNLTSRRLAKHKHKSSELTIATMTEKRMSHMTGSSVTLASSPTHSPTRSPTRHSQAYDPLIDDSRKVAFFHTRMNSDDSFSPHNPQTARESKTNLPAQVYQQPRSARTSRVDLHSRDGRTYTRSSTRRTFVTAPSNAPPMPQSTHTTMVTAASRRMSQVTSASKKERASKHISTASTLVPEPVEDVPIQAQTSAEQRASLQSDNWFVHTPSPVSALSASVYSDHSDHEAEYDPFKYSTTPSQYLRAQKRKQSQKKQKHTYTPVAAGDASDISDYETTGPKTMDSMAPAPKTIVSRLQDENFIPQPLGMHPPTPPVPTKQNTPQRTKSRYYGDLKAAQSGIRGIGVSSKASEKNESPRVVSRTGVDLAETYQESPNSRREVSGKILEEGRGGLGVGKWGTVRRRVSGVV